MGAERSYKYFAVMNDQMDFDTHTTNTDSIKYRKLGN